MHEEFNRVRTDRQTIRDREACIGLILQTLPRENVRAAKTILPFFAEELEDAVKYRYHALLTDGISPSARRLFLRISEDEMYHFDTLGKIILAMGLNPVPPTRIHIPTVSISSMESRPDTFAKRIIESDIRDEIAGHEKYNRAAAALPSEYFELANLLSAFAEDELMHKKALASLVINGDL
ncbi:MAG: hypothetical protein E7589_06680 [Ruminococcaceae bacterium]|nr:hypothetical protein [Oscillospiraceae bacterium]